MSANLECPEYPKRVLATSVAIFFALLFANLFFQFENKKLSAEFSEKTRTLEILRHELKQNQQLMELAVRMSAFSGYVSWENIHFRNHRAFRSRIEAIRAILPSFPQLENSENEKALRSLDEKIFEAVRNGRLREAKTIVESIERARLVSRQEQAVIEGDAIIARLIDNQSAVLRRQSIFSDWINVGMILILLALTISVARILNTWGARMRQSNAELDTLVREKVKELDQEKVRLIGASKMASLGEMAGGIAHEINNPLAIIKINSELLREMFAEGTASKEMVSGITTTIEKTTQRIAAIIKGLSTFARDGANDPFVPVPVQIIIKETLDLCREKLKNHDVFLEVTAPSTPVEIECRQSQISQVILNLVSNAADAVENLEQKWIKIHLAEYPETVELSITDSGAGIPPVIQEKIMQPFFTTKSVGKGTGLGLSISSTIIQTHQGFIAIDQNSPNTRFVIKLPKKHDQHL